ncbi:MAG: hypothetical protein DRJ07_09720 [Bacteroidetes bacterium]|nr:MAG: hypothetical protein DRJ07_09720 [Bacteroidota bacterium]
MKLKVTSKNPNFSVTHPTVGGSKYLLRQALLITFTEVNSSFIKFESFRSSGTGIEFLIFRGHLNRFY